MNSPYYPANITIMMGQCSIPENVNKIFFIFLFSFRTKSYKPLPTLSVFLCFLDTTLSVNLYYFVLVFPNTSYLLLITGHFIYNKPIFYLPQKFIY